MQFHYFWNFDFSKVRISFAKTYLELQVKFHSRVAFRKWYSKALLLFYTTFKQCEIK